VVLAGACGSATEEPSTQEPSADGLGQRVVQVERYGLALTVPTGWDAEIARGAVRFANRELPSRWGPRELEPADLVVEVLEHDPVTGDRSDARLLDHAPSLAVDAFGAPEPGTYYPESHGVVTLPFWVAGRFFVLFAESGTRPADPAAVEAANEFLATLAVDRQAINQAESLGFSKITGSIIPTSFDFYWQPPVIPFDLARAKQLLAEAGYPKGFEGGDLWCDVSVCATAEAVLNYLQAAGIKGKLRPMERAAMLSAFREKKLKNLVFSISGISGNAATRIDAFAASSGPYAYGAYPDIDGLFREQASELDSKKREAIVHRIQQLMHEKVMFLPVWQLSALTGYGPRVAESGLSLITDYPWSAPYEDVKLKPK